MYGVFNMTKEEIKWVIKIESIMVSQKQISIAPIYK